MLDDLVRGAGRDSARVPGRDSARRPLTEFLGEYESDPSLDLAGRGGKKRLPSAGQVKLTLQQARDVVAGCAFATPADLNADAPAKGAKYVVSTLDGPRFADFHSLWHSHLSELAAAGMGAKELQELARHSDVRLTLGIYTHARADQLGSAAARHPLPGGGEGNPLAKAQPDQPGGRGTRPRRRSPDADRVRGHRGYTPGYTRFCVRGEIGRDGVRPTALAELRHGV
jgi:hypothetical protein